MRRLLSKVLLVCCCALTFLPTCAKAVPTQNDFQTWMIVTGTGPLAMNGKLRWYLESQPRFGSDSTGIERYILRGALGYKVLEHLTLWAGYGWTPTFVNAKYDNVFTDESRWWQQALYDQSVGSFDLIHRLRIEQRYIERTSGVSHRARYLLRASHLLGTTDGGLGYGLTGYNEIFLNINGRQPGPEPGFDRDRVFVGPYIKKDHVRVEVGYLGEFSRRRNLDDRMINALALNVGFSF